MLTGESVFHEFHYCNPTEGAICIDPDRDVRRSCGCVSLVPSRRELPPAADCTVAMKLRLGTRVGPFEHTGTLIWRTAAGSALETVFRIKGIAATPFQTSPAALQFQSDDSGNVAPLDLEITSAADVDWQTVKVSPSSPLFVLRGMVKENNRIRCKVACVLPPDMEHISGSLL